MRYIKGERKGLCTVRVPWARGITVGVWARRVPWLKQLLCSLATADGSFFWTTKMTHRSTGRDSLEIKKKVFEAWCLLIMKTRSALVALEGHMPLFFCPFEGRLF